MKKIIFLLLSSISFFSFASNLEYESYTKRGLEIMRESNISQHLNKLGQSGSSQTIEVFSGKNKYTKSKGILLGTTSTYTKNPNFHLGVTVSYQKYKLNDNDFKTRDYSLNTYYSYKYEKNIFLAGLGYAQRKNIEKREFNASLEYGRILSDNLFGYVSVENFERKYKTLNSQNHFEYSAGVERRDFINNFKFLNAVEITANNKNNKNKFSLRSGISYYIYDDLSLDFLYRFSKFDDKKNNTFTLGFTHNF